MDAYQFFNGVVNVRLHDSDLAEGKKSEKRSKKTGLTMQTLVSGYNVSSLESHLVGCPLMKKSCLFVGVEAKIPRSC